MRLLFNKFSLHLYRRLGFLIPTIMFNFEQEDHRDEDITTCKHEAKREKIL